MSDEYEDARRWLLEMIAAIQSDYQRQIQPYIDQLARLEATRQPSPMTVFCRELPPELLAQMTTDQPTVVAECQHEWADARNNVISSGEWCRKCSLVRAGNEATGS